MSYPLVRELAAEGIPVRLTCGVLGFTAQAFYKWQANPISDRDLDDAYLTNELFDAHADDPEFGYRFLADELERAGHTVGERRVWRLCNQQRLWSTTVRKGRRGSGKQPGPAVHDDLVQRNFTADAPNAVWVTDITEHPHRRRQALLLPDQGPVLEPDRRLRDQRTDDPRVGGQRPALGDRPPPIRRHGDRSLGQRLAIPFTRFRRGAQSSRPVRIDGPRRRGR